MGLLRKVWHTASKDWKNANYQLKAVLKAKSIEKGEKVPAPKYPSDAEQFEKAQNDPELKKLVDEKDEKLIENVNKINIKATDPPEKWTSTKQFPTRETEWEHRNDPIWEYGFYEPPLEKMEKNRIMLREAVELLRNRIEFELPGPDGSKRKFAEEAFKKYNEHPSTSRVDQEKLDRMWEFFRPFERHDTQRVVKKEDLKELRDILEGRSQDKSLANMNLGLTLEAEKDQSHRSAFAKKLLQMTDEEKKEFLTGLQEKKEAERKRLTERLKEIKLIESQLDEKNDEKEKNG